MAAPRGSGWLGFEQLPDHFLLVPTGTWPAETGASASSLLWLLDRYRHRSAHLGRVLPAEQGAHRLPHRRSLLSDQQRTTHSTCPRQKQTELPIQGQFCTASNRQEPHVPRAPPQSLGQDWLPGCTQGTCAVLPAMAHTTVIHPGCQSSRGTSLVNTWKLPVWRQ